MQNENVQNNVNKPTQDISASQQISSNANLKILQLNTEGISPNFSPENIQYYITISENIDNIEVIAEPENSRSTLQIVGNTNIPYGTSKIVITVTAENGDKKDYTINVSKTNNVEQANANLENLAIENTTLNPEFNPDIVDYTIEVSGEMESLNILAVPQNENAKVSIEGNENLQYGDNYIKIIVTSEDGENSKVYNIIATKKEIINIEASTDKRNNENNGGADTIENNTENGKNKGKIYIGFSIVFMIALVSFIMLKKRKSKKIINGEK